MRLILLDRMDSGTRPHHIDRNQPFQQSAHMIYCTLLGDKNNYQRKHQKDRREEQYDLTQLISFPHCHNHKEVINPIYQEIVEVLELAWSGKDSSETVDHIVFEEMSE